MGTINASLAGRPRIAVLGGGISGLSGAFRLTEVLPRAAVTLYEAGSRLGGLISTRREGGYLVETGPLAFPTGSPATGALVRAAGLLDRCLPSRQGGGLGLWDGGRMVPVPKTPLQVLRLKLLSPKGLLRLLGEPFMPGNPPGRDESILDFFRRRTGLDFFQSLVEPLASGVLAGDPGNLSMAANLTRLHAMERDSGSLAKGLWRERRIAERGAGSPPDIPAAATTREGCSGLIDGLAEELERRGVEIRLGRPVRALARKHARYVVSEGPSEPPEAYDAVVSALPSHALSDLLSEWPREVSAFLAGIPHAPMVVLYLGFPKEAIAGRFQGEGFLVQPKAREPVLSCFLPSRMADGRAPAGHELLRVLAGGAKRPHIPRLDDRQLNALVLPTVRRMLRTDGEPVFTAPIRHGSCLPQLVVGHDEGLARTRAWYAREWPGFFAAGTSLYGPGIENAVVSGRQAAEEAAAYLAPKAAA